MSAINALYKRNSRLFLRDRMTLFFSFLSALILVALYFLFIAKLYTESMSSLSSGSSGFSLDANSKNFIVYLQMMAGVLVLNSISFATGVFSIIAKDFENRKVDSFLLTPVKPYKLVLAYFFTGLIVSFFINAVTWIITVFIIGFATGFWISIPTFLSCMLVLFISSIISCSMMLLVVTLTKSSTAIGVINGVLGSFMGFLCGIYIPYYNLGEKTVMIGSLIPFSHLTIWLKRIVLGDAFSQVGIPETYIHVLYKDYFSSESIGFLKCDISLETMIILSFFFALICAATAYKLLCNRLKSG